MISLAANGKAPPSKCLRDKKWQTQTPVSWLDIERRPATGVRVEADLSKICKQSGTSRRHELILQALLLLVGEGVITDEQAWALL